jgi:hypothetical protein
MCARMCLWGVHREVRHAGVLRDVHVGPDLPGSRVPGGTQHLVRGPYQYFHYLQHRFNDKGWGCAYRSMQVPCPVSVRARGFLRVYLQLCVLCGVFPAWGMGERCLAWLPPFGSRHTDCSRWAGAPPCPPDAGVVVQAEPANGQGSSHPRGDPVVLGGRRRQTAIVCWCATPACAACLRRAPPHTCSGGAVLRCTRRAAVAVATAVASRPVGSWAVGRGGSHHTRAPGQGASVGCSSGALARCAGTVVRVPCSLSPPPVACVPARGGPRGCAACMPARWAGSQQWIGSFEIQTCLADMYGIQARIETVSSGSELASRARLLAHHFDTVGTPVMMGACRGLRRRPRCAQSAQTLPWRVPNMPCSSA